MAMVVVTGGGRGARELRFPEGEVGEPQPGQTSRTYRLVGTREGHRPSSNAHRVQTWTTKEEEAREGPHCTEEETEAHRGEVTCLRSHGKGGTETRFEPKLI